MNVDAFDIGQYTFAKDNTGREFNMLLDIFGSLEVEQFYECNIKGSSQSTKVSTFVQKYE